MASKIVGGAAAMASFVFLAYIVCAGKANGQTALTPCAQYRAFQEALRAAAAGEMPLSHEHRALVAGMIAHLLPMMDGTPRDATLGHTDPEVLTRLANQVGPMADKTCRQEAQWKAMDTYLNGQRQ